MLSVANYVVNAGEMEFFSERMSPAKNHMVRLLFELRFNFAVPECDAEARHLLQQRGAVLRLSDKEIAKHHALG
jgi:hypothetical protein